MTTLMNKRVVIVGGSSGIDLGVAVAASAGRGARDRRSIGREAASGGANAGSFVGGKLIGAMMLAKHAARTSTRRGSMIFTSRIKNPRGRSRA
jgi:hypothetical protein